MIKKILVGLVLIAVVLALLGFLLPRNAHVERSITIDRPAASIFAVMAVVLLVRPRGLLGLRQ